MTTEQDQQSRAMVPGDELHLSLLMAHHGLNLVSGQDRAHLLAYARDVWQAARALPVGMEPETWAIYDAEGLYETRDTEEDCKSFCDHYNARDKKLGGGLGPYTYKPLFTAAQVQAMGRVPPGWQAVPVEPTGDMLVAIMSSGEVDVLRETPEKHQVLLIDRAGIPNRYTALLATAPRPPAAQELKPLTPEQIHKWWASENGLEDCDIGKLIDFTTVVREFESKLGIK